MIVRVLGSAAGGGVPQWNCACVNCTAARSGSAPARTQSSLAISADGERWLLLNCSPDIAAQIEDFAPLHPRSMRGTPIEGVLITDANVDHIGGLAVLRQRGQSAGFRVRSSAVVRTIATAQPSFAPFAAPPHRWLELPLDERCRDDGAGDLVGNVLSVRAIAVPGTTPGYDGRRAVRGAVVAYEIAERGSDKSLLFAPVFAAIDAKLGAAIAAASVAFVDGSFFSDAELDEVGLHKRARALGHQPVGGPDGTLTQLRPSATRLIFTHVNNSNPLLDSRSEESASLYELGAEVAFDGMDVTL